MIFTPVAIGVVGSENPMKPESQGDRAKRSTIFETPIGSDRFNRMPQSSNDPEVLRTATGLAGMRQNLRNGMDMPVDRSVQSVRRPRRGHDY